MFIKENEFPIEHVYCIYSVQYVSALYLVYVKTPQTLSYLKLVLSNMFF